MRKIIHIDCDCFFAAVEMRDNPALRSLPVAVGGKAEARGVLATCNYVARQFGLHSAMATSEAFRRCPQLVLVEPRFSAYREASTHIREIFARYTSKIEPLSLDEAYLDVSQAPHCKGSATLIARAIRADIAHEVGVTASAGIASNKFLAKIASDWKKPDNQFVIKPAQVADFVKTLPVQKIPGVGHATLQRMQQLNIATCTDLQRADLRTLIKHFGSFGPRLQQLAFGIDHREVDSHYLRKSLSVEHTFPADLDSEDACLSAMPPLLATLDTRLNALRDHHPIQKLVVKVKFSDFTSTTMECRGTYTSAAIFRQLVLQACQRKHLPVRLLGVGVGFREPVDAVQLSLF